MIPIVIFYLPLTYLSVCLSVCLSIYLLNYLFVFLGLLIVLYRFAFVQQKLELRLTTIFAATQCPTESIEQDDW